ncbi:MAG: hypothetical protein WA624_12810 [Methylocella sp.]
MPFTNSPGAAAAFTHAGADQFALGTPTAHGQHQAPVTTGAANVVAICFAAFQWGGKKCCLDALFWVLS